ncbi:DUF4136 domain-containing protein [Oscillatoria amoena NRMC-F 0135]|nr:DUF4136 domain-containing protein [Oscillatoria amoena NRMC-F 0135]
MIRQLITTICIALTVSCFGQDFKSSTKTGVDLKQYSTFTIVQGEVVASSDRAIDPVAFFKEIKPTIIRELERKGFKYVDSAAELAATYVVETTVRTDVQNFGPLGQAPASNPAQVDQSQSWSREFRQGSLILNLDDLAKKTTVWSCEGSMDISRTRGGNAIDYAVKEAFRKFPDKNKKSKRQKTKKG